jgi:hypothetical protein
MGTKKALFAVGTTALTAFGTFVACGSDKAKSPDAAVQQDAPADSPKPIDAAPDASPYDFTCYGMSNPGSAADPITVAGTTESFSMGGATPVGNAAVAVYKDGVAVAVASATSDGSGAFTAAPAIVTAGSPFAGYIKAKLAAYRVSYLYPPNPIVASIASLPLPMISTSTWDLLKQFAGVTQNDTTNGALLITVTDCANMPINGATLKVQQAGSDVGVQHDLGQVVSQAAGIIIVSDVPDGATDVSATFGNMTFPVHTVIAHKEEAVGSGAGSGSAEIEGTLSLTTVRPGP